MGTTTCRRSDGPITETYRGVEALIHKIVHDFARKNGQYHNYDEMVSEANLAFLKAYERHDRYRGSFSTVLSTAVKNRLIDFLRKERKWTERNRISDAEEIKTGISDPVTYDAPPVSLSDQAAFVVRMVLSSPPCVRRQLEKKGKTPRTWKKAIRDHLLNLGWSVEAIAEGFEEVGKAYMS